MTDEDGLFIKVITIGEDDSVTLVLDNGIELDVADDGIGYDGYYVTYKSIVSIINDAKQRDLARGPIIEG